MGNVHIYDEHIETLSKQTTNEIHTFPTIKIANKYENIEDYKLEDFLINNYITNDKVIMKMRT